MRPTSSRRSPALDYRAAAAVPLAGLTAWQGLFDHGHLDEGKVHPHVSAVFELGAAAEAQSQLEKHHAQGKVVLQMG